MLMYFIELNHSDLAEREWQVRKLGIYTLYIENKEYIQHLIWILCLQEIVDSSWYAVR